MIVMGVDPGLTGAVAYIDTADMSAMVYDMPTFTVKVNGSMKSKVDAVTLRKLILLAAPDCAVIEKVGAMPGQGVTSMFGFGYSAGLVHGALAALDVPVDFMTPQHWQKWAKAGRNKDRSRERAAKLFPHLAGMFDRKKDNGRSDAVLIAYAGVLSKGML